jgi:hypothetical protein
LAAAGGRFISAGSSFNYGVIGEGTTGGGLLRRTDNTGAVQTTGFIGFLGSDGLNTPNNLTVSGVKSFAEPHPSDASKVIKYVALEGPEAGTYFRGRGRFVGGRATIEVPESFRMVTDTEGLTVQVTPMGRPAAVAVISMGLDKIEVEATRDVEFSYLAQGVRRAFKDFQVIQNDEFYYVPEGPDAKLPGYYAEDVKQRLIANGTYLPDGSVNMSTAERLGWAHNWREAEAKKRAFESRLVKSSPFDSAPAGTH